MTRPVRGSMLRNSLPLLLVAAVIAAVYAPSAFGSAGGVDADFPGWDPSHGGCTSCHGGEKFATQGAPITVTFTDADGTALDSIYKHEATYTITISLDERNEPGEASRAGFNFFIDGGKLAATGDETARVTAAGDEGTHTGPGFTTWTLSWTAPDEGAVTWRLFVNDVDGNNVPNAADQVYLKGGWITDDHYGMPGAVEEHEVHYGIALPQYWLGLIALASMAFVILFSFVYLKFVNPDHSDQGDR